MLRFILNFVHIIYSYLHTFCENCIHLYINYVGMKNSVNLYFCQVSLFVSIFRFRVGSI